MGHYFFQQVLCRRADQALAQCRQDSILTSIQARRPHIAVGGGCPAVPKEYLCAVEAHSLECHRCRAMPDGMEAERLNTSSFGERAHKLAALLKGLAQHAVAVYLHKDVIRLAGPRLAPPLKSLAQLRVDNTGNSQIADASRRGVHFSPNSTYLALTAPGLFRTYSAHCRRGVEIRSFHLPLPQEKFFSKFESAIARSWMTFTCYFRKWDNRHRCLRLCVIDNTFAGYGNFTVGYGNNFALSHKNFNFGKIENELLWSECFATHLLPSLAPPYTYFIGVQVF